MNLSFTLYYRSDFEHAIYWEDLGLPYRFWSNVLENMEWGRDIGYYATIQIGNGDVMTFFKQGDRWMPSSPESPIFFGSVYPVPWQLQDTAKFFYLMDPIRQQVHIFERVGRFGRVARIVDRNGNQLIFSYQGMNDLFPTRVEDGLGRALELTYRRIGRETVLVKVTDQAGREVTFDYDPRGQDNNGAVTLRSISDPLGNTTNFSYTWVRVSRHFTWEHQLVAVELPEGNVPYRQTYENVPLDGRAGARVTAQEDAYGHVMELAYDPNSCRVSVTAPDGTTQVFEHYGEHSVPRTVTDPLGHVIRFGWDEASQRLTSVTDRLGNTTRVTYHPESGRIASWTDAEGNTTSFIYTAQEQTIANPAAGETVTFTFYNLTRIDYPDGTHESYAYDAKGNVIARTDRTGAEWRYTYNGRGQLLTVTNPEGGVITCTYNPDATLATRTDSDLGVTSYAYDAYKRLSAITRPDGATVHFTYDLNDRLLTATDELGRVISYTYDANGNLTGIAAPWGELAYSYDLMDRLIGATDPLGQSSQRTYDEIGRLASLTDRNGNTTTYAYDPRGWLTGITDPAGHTWSSAYNDEGVPTAFTTPLGHTTAFQTDNLGRIMAITDPLGATATFSYDARGRLTSTTDRAGRTITYDYDDAGRLVGVTAPVIGTATYTRDDLGLLSRITDPSGKAWGFGYSPMGRLTSHTDPLGNEWSYSYDVLGRLSQITYPDSTTTAYTYDAAGRVTQIAYPDGLTLHFTYDDAGRLLTAGDIAFTRDARGDITASRDGSASFGATYDPGRRLKTVTYDGQATVTYTYDARDLLTRVEDDLSGAWMEFTYDADARLIQAQRSNGVTTTYTYDAAGRVIRIQDGALADQRYTLNDAGEPMEALVQLPLGPDEVTYSYDEAGRLVGADYGEGGLAWEYDAAGNLSRRAGSLPLTGAAVSDAYSYDLADRISTPGYAYDARGRQTSAPGKAFAYDGASRLTSVSADGATATFTYNGLGDLRARTAGGATTHYYHNYALGMNPIVAEKTGAAYKRFYIYTPGGSLLYSIEPGSGAVRFYHFDRIGSTLFLTDGAGAVSDAYAYDPYGDLLGHTGTSDQLFTYLGRYGVRYEPVGALYDMRARVYDPATARFLTRDPAWPALRDLRSLNPYAYAAQSPLRYIDPQGTTSSSLGALLSAMPTQNWFVSLAFGSGGEAGRELFNRVFPTLPESLANTIIGSGLALALERNIWLVAQGLRPSGLVLENEVPPEAPSLGGALEETVDNPVDTSPSPEQPY